jgi:hypothetical protein
MKRDMEKFKLKKNPSRINYGFCNKKKKEITFMPNYCQPENEDCFKHRK